MVTKGLWPLGLSRAASDFLKSGRPFESPMGEVCFIRDIGGNTWIYPNWILDLSEEEPLLAEAGCQVFIHLQEPPPKTLQLADRPGRFNWDLQLY